MLIFLIAIATRAQTAPCSPALLADTLKVTLKMVCDSREIARRVAAGEETVPKLVYHFGPRKYVQEDIAAGNIPQKAWDETIMGEGNGSLGSTRRGLYVTAGVDTNYYGEQGADRAILEVQLKDSCRAPESVAPYRYLPRSDRFRRWYAALPASERPFPSPEDMEKKCYFPVNGYPIATKYGFDPKHDCGRVVARYFDETGIKVVVDHHREKAFYIRDRACIEKLRGTNDDLIDMATRNQMLWMEMCNRDGNWGAPAFSDNVLRALLERDQPVDKSVLDKIIENATLARRDRRFREYRECAAKNQIDRFRAAYAKPTYQLSNLLKTPCGD